MQVSMIDASNACVFVRAADLGMTGKEAPAVIEEDAALMRRLAAIRMAASLRMGLARDEAEAAARTAVPFIGFVAPPSPFTTLSGSVVAEDEVDVIARVISNGQPHRALPLGVSMCLAAAARIEGSIVQQACRQAADPNGDLCLGMPSGILRVSAEVRQESGGWRVVRGGFYRTQRRLFEGSLLIRDGAWPS
jgi:2-methylaconitate cis-trans-isomerase PrpF